MALRARPVSSQLFPVQAGPFNYNAQSTGWQIPGNYGKAGYFNQSFKLIVFCMEMRRGMIVEIHVDDDAVKSGNFGDTVQAKVLGRKDSTG